MNLGNLWQGTQNLFGFGANTPQSYMPYNSESSNLMFNDSLTGSELGSNQNMMGDLWSKFKGSSFKDQASAAGSLIGGLGTAYNAYNTVKTANEQLAFTKDAWNKQYQANANLTNASLADRQAARVASNPTAYQSVDNYMKKYGVK